MPTGYFARTKNGQKRVTGAVEFSGTAVFGLHRFLHRPEGGEGL
jgi:hypothetical protein